MKLSLSPSSRFLLCVAAVLIAVWALLVFAVPFDFCAEHHLAWAYLAVTKLIDLAYLILAVWAGQMLRKVWPDSGKALRIALLIIAVLAVIVSGLHQEYPRNDYFFFILLGCAILSYLFPFERVKQHGRGELIVMAALMAFFYAACYGLVGHRWAMIPAALGFLYYIVLLSKEFEKPTLNK